jgi:transposase
MVNEILKSMDSDFDTLYAESGRPSIAPEYLLRASTLQILFAVRSERQLMEQIEFNMLFRWFVGLSLDAPAWDHSTFAKNRDRLMEAEITKLFFGKVLGCARKKKLLSDEHFSVDGTLIEAWAGMKSFQAKEGGGNDPEGPKGGKDVEVDFHGEKRTNQTHESKTDPDSRLYRKSKGSEAKLVHMGHVLMENRNGLAVDASVAMADGHAERDAAVEMAWQLGGSKRLTVGADKGYDSEDFVKEMRDMNVAPHVAKKVVGKTIDGRATRHEGYRISQNKRKRIEQIFGRAKTVGLIRKAKMRGVEKIDWLFSMSIAVFNLIRIRNLVYV